MPRCDYDIIFYRVFCITLLAIAFTFTVILTNVFVDIDGLLSNEEKAKNFDMPSKLEAAFEEAPEDIPTDNSNIEMMYSLDKQLEFEGENVVDRKKRSPETITEKKYKIKNQRLKQLLTRQLATLLEEIDSESEDITKKTDKYDTSLIPDNLDDVAKQYLTEESTKREKDDGLLHMAIHHLLLNGFTSHMDMHDMYRAILDLSKNLRTNVLKTRRKDNPELRYAVETTEEPTTQTSNEIQFNDEVVNYDGKDMSTLKFDVDTENEKELNDSATAKSDIIINTVIDIKKDDKTLNKTGKGNIKGIIKLIYNGKPIEISSHNYEIKQSTPKPTTTTTKSETTTEPTIKTETLESENLSPKNTPEYYFKKALADYAYKYYKTGVDKTPDMKELLTKSRSKRQTLGSTKETILKHKDKNNTKRHQDELFVEIETHIDDRDLRNDKRKNKVIKNLINKIQHAIYSNIGNLQTKEKRKHRFIQIKKRLMTPVDDKIINKISIPMEPVVHRQLDPITKIINMRNQDSKLSTKLLGQYKGRQPSFLSNTKTINSAENGNVHVTYDKVITEIPQRFQIPLYNDDDDVLNFGNLKFSIKNLGSSGLALGINQYVDTTADADKYVVFDKLEKMMEGFPDAVDEINNTKNSTVTNSLNKQLLKAMTSLHGIGKRDINVQHFDKNHVKRKLVHSTNNIERTQTKEPENEMEFDYGVGVKDLLSLEQNDEKLTKGLRLDSFDRTKRYISQVRHISSIRNKVKLNKYLNTDVMASKSLLWKKNRLKRDSDSVLLTDLTNPRVIPPEIYIDNPYDQSQNMYEASGENLRLYDDRKPREMESYVDRNGENSFSMLSQPTLGYILNSQVQQNSLRPRYPHITMGFDKSKENDDKPEARDDFSQIHAHIPLQNDDNIPFEELVNAISPKTSYKITVKLSPKNHSQSHVEARKSDITINEPEKELEEYKNDEMEEKSKIIDKELESLLQQKETLETLFNERPGESNGKDLIELYLPFNPPKILHLTKEDVGKLIKTALKKLKDLSPSADKKPSIPQIHQSTTTTTSTTTAKPVHSAGSGISIHDFKTVTNEILNKIERNSNYFQAFLNKLTLKLDQPQNQEDIKNSLLYRRMNINNSNDNEEILQMKDMKEFIPTMIHHAPVMLPSAPSFEVNKNGTVIPFIYAYQHALPSFNGSKTSDHLANVVYHGHIHANTMPYNKRNRQGNVFFKDKTALNNSKYFLDELERGRRPIKLFKLMKKSGMNK